MHSSDKFRMKGLRKRGKSTEEYEIITQQIDKKQRTETKTSTHLTFNNNHTTNINTNNNNDNNNTFNTSTKNENTPFKNFMSTLSPLVDKQDNRFMA